MQTGEIYAKLTPIFQDLFDDPDLVLKPALTAADVADWDSMNHMRLVLSVQKTFGVKFSALEVGRLNNVGEFVQLIASKL